MTIPTNWLENSDYPKCIVAIFDYYTDSVNTMYLSTHKKIATYNGIEMCFNPRLYGDIVFKTGLADSNNGVRTTVSVGNLKLLNSDGVLDNWLDLGLDGRLLKLYIVPIEATNINVEGLLIFEGSINRLEITDNNTLSIIFSDPLLLLDFPIQSTLYTEGEVITYNILGVTKTVSISTELKDKPKPIVYGKVFNIEPILLSASSKVYQVDSTPISSVVGVYDRGVPLTLGIGYNVDLDNGIIELINNTSGTITCDILGRKVDAGNYTDSVSLIIKHILEEKNISSTSIKLDNNINVPVGIYISERENTLDVLDALVGSFDGIFGFDFRGDFRLSCLTIPNTSTPSYIEFSKASKYGDVISDGVKDYMLSSDLLGIPDYSSIQTLSLSGLITEFNVPYYLDESATLGDISITSTNNIAYRAKVKHSKNYTVQTDIASSAPSTRREFISKAFREYSLDNIGIKTKHIRAIEKEPYDTLLVSEFSASILANRFITKNTRQVFEVKLRVADFKLIKANIGSVIHLKDHRYGFDTGILATIREIEINYLYGYVELTAVFSRVPNQDGYYSYDIGYTPIHYSSGLTIPAAHDRGRRYFSFNKVMGTNNYTTLNIHTVLTPSGFDPTIILSQVIANQLEVLVFNNAFEYNSRFSIQDSDMVVLLDFDAKRFAIYNESGHLYGHFPLELSIMGRNYRKIEVYNADTADTSTLKFNVVNLPLSDCLPWGIIETKKDFDYEV